MPDSWRAAQSWEIAVWAADKADAEKRDHHQRKTENRQIRRAPAAPTAAHACGKQDQINEKWEPDFLSIQMFTFNYPCYRWNRNQ